MGKLTDSILNAIAAERVLISSHADDMLRERGIEVWQVVAEAPSARRLVERRNAHPNPVAEFELILADGTAAKAVWAYLARLDVAKLVTVHFSDR